MTKETLDRLEKEGLGLSRCDLKNISIPIETLMQLITAARELESVKAERDKAQAELAELRGLPINDLKLCVSSVFRKDITLGQAFDAAKKSQ